MTGRHHPRRSRWKIAAAGGVVVLVGVALLAMRVGDNLPVPEAAPTPAAVPTVRTTSPADLTPAPIFTPPAPDDPQPWSPDDGPLHPSTPPTADPADRSTAPAGRASRPVPPPPAGGSTDPEDLGAGDQAPPPAATPLVAGLVDLVNRDRAAAGCGPVAVHPDLQRQAERHAVAQASADRMYHSTGVTGFDYWGENVAYGYADAAEVHGGWMSSPSHRDNVLNCDWHWIGAAHADSPTGVRYWTEQFAA